MGLAQIGSVVMPVAMVSAMAFQAAGPRQALGQAAAARQAQPSRPAAAATSPQGEELFSMTCSVCHGKAGTGSIGPALRGPKFTRDFVASAVRTGRPGTMMSSFVSSFTAAEINAISAYVASLQVPTGPAPDGLRGEAARGEQVFFANVVYACGNCHTINNRGSKVGPDLTTRARALTPRDLFQRIVVVPHRETEAKYTTVRLTTRQMVIEGIPSGETADIVYFYDTSTLPPLLRRIPKKDIVSQERRDNSVMPNDYASKLTLQQLLDVVAFLKYRDGQPVTLAQVVK
jgi:putative heme-binding domain-containing protein